MSPGGCFLLKVLFFESYYFSFHGAQQSLLSLVRRLNKAKFEPVIVVPGEGPLQEEAVKHHMAVEVVPYPRQLNMFNKKLIKSPWRILLSVIYLVQYSVRLFQLIKTHRPRVICANQLRSVLTIGWISRLLGIPLIWYLRIDQRAGLLDLIGLLLSTRVVAVSRGVTSIFGKSIKKKYGKKIIVIYDGLDAEKLESCHENWRKSDGIPDSAFVFAMVSSMHPRKGHRYFIEAAKRLVEDFPDTHFLIVGKALNENEITYESEIKKLVKELRIEENVLFLGFRRDVPAILNGIDCLVLPSTSEGLPLVLLEAMAAGKPVIASNVGGCAEVVIDGETGILVTPRDVDSLYNAMQKIRTSPTMAKTMGNKGKQRVHQHFNLEKCVREFEKLLEQLGEKAKWK
ncbi:MAG: glycosyltransferase family 4 protein [Geminocystis sp.]|nr:glycosyltransferase family 4 protein [Geminocystis sp.]